MMVRRGRIGKLEGLVSSVVVVVVGFFLFLAVEVDEERRWWWWKWAWVIGIADGEEAVKT